ncbi:hypothetical protein LIER_11014 [Lithospermum erythrorhizon]|uniref:RING-CH-type domain-containing protein n=1 Tax=Lithospermum erythrorhizon TaxID=34254 RepID=A0AAV3PLH9_LITER
MIYGIMNPSHVSSHGCSPVYNSVSKMEKENLPTAYDTEGGKCSPVKKTSETYDVSLCSVDKDAGLTTCRVCQCLESDRRGDVALGFLGISVPQEDAVKNIEERKSDENVVAKDIEGGSCDMMNFQKRSELVEFISPSGEVFLCRGDIETGVDCDQDKLIELGCACKNDLAFVHYSCALKWFVNHGSTICEICGRLAKNIRTSDFKKVLSSLKEYEVLREKTANGETNFANLPAGSGVDPDALAAIRRQRLSEISLWFSPHNASNAATFSQTVSEPDAASNIVLEDATLAQSNATKWAVEATGILLATGLLTVTLAWLIAPHVGKKTAKNGLHFLLGGVCALTVVMFFRFFVLTRIKYGPARYWAILFVFWFLVFGIWASRTHNSHAT